MIDGLASRVEQQLSRTGGFAFVIFLLVALLARVILWSSDAFILNGDESILALMAKHLSEGKEFTLYFYGQRYGLSILETGLMALLYTLFGISDEVFRMAQLILFTLGTTFFYKTLTSLRIEFRYSYAWLICLLLLISPTWMRLPYVTPYLFTFVFIYFLLCKQHTAWQAYIIGLLLVMLYESHRLWVPPLLLFFLAYALPTWNSKKYLKAGITVALSALLFHLYKSGLHDAWHPQVTNLENLDQEKLDKVPGQLFQMLSGFFYLFDSYDIPTAVIWAIRAFLFILLISVVVFIRDAWQQRKMDWTSWSLMAGLVGITVYIAVARMESLRYLLPFSQFAFLLIGLSLWRVGRRAFIPLLTLAVIVNVLSLGAWAQYRYYSVSAGTLDEVITELLEHDQHRVFCNEPLAQWQIMYYSREQVICRFHGSTDRYPPYVQAVDEQFTSRSTGTLVARKWKIPDLEPDFISRDGDFAVYYGLDQEELENLGFEWNR